MSTYEIEDGIVLPVLKRRKKTIESEVIETDSKIKIELINELFTCNLTTGELFWKVKKSQSVIGRSAGYRDPKGYVVVSVNGKKFPVHRIIFLLAYGYWPENDIDHINRNKWDNRPCNLREISRSCNCRNTSTDNRTTSGIKGVTYRKSNRTYVSVIFVEGSSRYLYQGRDLIEAVAYRYAAEQCLNWNECCADSPAYKYLKEQGVLM